MWSRSATISTNDFRSSLVINREVWRADRSCRRRLRFIRTDFRTEGKTSRHGFSHSVPFFAPKAKLHATVSHTRFRLPKIVEDEYEKAAQLREPSTLEQAFAKESLAKYGLTREQAQQCAWLVNEHFREKIRRSLPYHVQDVSPLWTISVANGGRKRCEDVQVVIPRATMVFIERSDSEDEFRMITEKVLLGTLLPKDEVSMTAWSTLYTYPDKVRLSHSTGDGAVKELLLTPKFWNWMSDNWIGLLFVLICAAIPMCVTVLGITDYIAHKSPKSAVSTNSAAGAITYPPTSPFASLEAYCTQQDRLAGHFSERDEFDKRAVARTVSWEGFVCDVHDRGEALTLVVGSTATPTNKSCLCGVEFPPSVRVRLLALKRGDLVRFTGSITQADTPYISATDFSLQTP
jgi:hypothetical protein